MSEREQAMLALERVPDSDLSIVLNILLHYASDPDDILSPEDLADCQQAMEEYRRGEYVESKDIKR